MRFRIAAVSFLNAIPLIDWFDTEESPDVELMRALPSRLASMLDAGEADVALLPVVELFRGRASGVVPGSGICCRGAVASVKLFFRGDLAKLKKVYVDRGSRTSVALLQVLMAERYGCAPPPFCEFEPVAGMVPESGDGHLVIGDRCFDYQSALPDAASGRTSILDLGEAWLELTGMPFVFAAWCASRDFPERVGAEGVAELTDVLTRARQYGLANLKAIAAREAESRDPAHVFTANSDTLLYYFQKSLRYDIGVEEMAGLNHFHQLCIKHGLVARGPAPNVL